MPVTEKVEQAFRRVAGTAIATVGESAQNDLIFLGHALGMTEQELQDKFPNLYAESPVEEWEEHYPEDSEDEEEIDNEKEDSEEVN